MAERNEYFEQLLRGENVKSHPYAISGGIPHDERLAVREVILLLRRADDEAQTAMAAIRDIMRFHGGEAIRSQIRPQERELLPKLEAFVGPEDCEPDEA